MKIVKVECKEFDMSDTVVCIHKHCVACNEAGVRGEKPPHIHTDCKCEAHVAHYVELHVKRYYGYFPDDSHLKVGEYLLYCPYCKLQTDVDVTRAGAVTCTMWKCNKTMRFWKKELEGTTI